MRRQFVEDQRNTILKTTPEAGFPLSRSLYLRTVNWNIGYNPSCFSAWRNQIDVPPHSKTNWVFCTQNKHSFFNICNYLGCLRVILILIYSYIHTSLAWHLQMHRDQNCKHSSAQFHFFFFSARMSSHQLKHRSSMRPGREEPLILFRYVWICFIPVQLRGIAIAIILVGNELGAFYSLRFKL